MSCVLRANGSSFLFDEFLKDSDFVPCAVYRKGEARSSRKGPEKVEQSSGLHVVVSEAEFDTLDRQIQDAIAFMQQHKTELKRLCSFPGVEAVILDFGIEKRDVGSQFDYFPPVLLSLAGSLGIGIELSQYPAQIEAIQM